MTEEVRTIGRVLAIEHMTPEEIDTVAAGGPFYANDPFNTKPTYDSSGQEADCGVE